METKYTAGPWFADKPFRHDGQNVTPVVARDKDRLGGTWLVAWLHANAVPASEHKANVRLVTAAPEMLDALKAAIAWASAMTEAPAEVRPSWFDEARAAVAKATAMTANV